MWLIQDNFLLWVPSRSEIASAQYVLALNLECQSRYSTSHGLFDAPILDARADVSLPDTPSADDGRLVLVVLVPSDAVEYTCWP